MMKTFFRNIHLYLSLVAGTIIMLSCITGAIMVFEEEIDHVLNPSRYHVPIGELRLPVDTLKNIAITTAPQAKAISIKVYGHPEAPVEIGLILPEKKDP